jgi:hypothetical protein
VRDDRGVCNSFTAVPYLTNLIVRTDRRLLSAIVGGQTVWIKCRKSFNISAWTYIDVGTGWSSRTRNCAEGSIPDGVIAILYDFNFSSRAMACGGASNRNEYKEYFLEVKAAGV